MTETETIRRTERVRASELLGRGWLNTGGKDVSLEDLRGKIVILDFWTFCCINCLHVLDELRPLEQRFSDVLVTVGVHSPKFEHEADPDALAAAVERYEIAHPVLDDPNLVTWQAYSARAWPTLVVIDPQGYIAANLAGEGHVAGLTSLVEELVTEHEAKGTLHRGDGPYVPPEPVSRTLRFPGKAVPVGRELGGSDAAQGHFLVSDTGHHRIVELDADLATVVRSWGGGEDLQKGHHDGDPAAARFNEPQGLTVLPAELAQQVGYDIVVADTVNHRLRGINAETGEVTTVAGNGVQRLLDAERARAGAVESGSLGTDPLNVSLSSPWDVLWSNTLDLVVIAMAGTHQIFTFDPATGELSIFAGTGLEGLLDGSAETAWFAQTSGLTEDAAGDIWIADSETSALRVIRTGAASAEDATAAGAGGTEAPSPVVETLIGEGLFDFGFRDGAPGQARLQHPLGVTALPDGSVLMADTYNGAIRRYRGEHLAADGTTVAASVSTVARGLKEPSDVLLDADGTSLLVVETNAHELVRIAVPKEYLTVDEGATQSQRPSTAVAPGEFSLAIGFTAPTGQKLDDRWGDPTQLKVSSSPENLLLTGAGNSEGLRRTLQLNPEVSEGVLHITARAAACDGAPGEEIPMHAACHLYQQDWGIPVTLEVGAQSELTLDLRGVR
ncbi:NHL domain-containing thioredoxin family protein [Nesterenkonia sp. LB17]|uniref:NHL domain-containing thioredoxin family protein n=1 Tax=unclassified Nesterenkonia TaxID=2629769 RepID=UPI001F4CAB8F|nr:MULTISPECIES: NHL domain-containing thioredoxin family protein [unclassified Nesterenkonia]MCH8559993.1 NHL domain-containing thioredoxin family protein [Nesterenkonia sp. DZ6]MCH8562173.1 NHL domain-containing thioredoxin family protein [Nesterenkonia sp. YGD6]MCH8564294.1 NHL domain-containing thioredoxin family protein [Nesterenkonia sp. LB17]